MIPAPPPVVVCLSAEDTARWHAQVLSGAAHRECEPDERAVRGPSHLELLGPCTCASSAPATRALGGRTVSSLVVDELGSFQVVRDPEGNEFCFVAD